MVKKINRDYFRLINEFFIFLKISFNKKGLGFSSKKPKILISNSCLIGDFIVSLPSINRFIQENKHCRIDLIVSPTVESLAKKIKGINKVFVVKSVYSREIEDNFEELKLPSDYEEIIFMRGNKESYEAIKHLKNCKVKTSLIPMVRYGFHLAKNLALKNPVKQWREVNFEILGQKPQNVQFKDIFNFSKRDYLKIKKLSVLNTRDKIIIIHTGSSWAMNIWENEKWVNLIKKINSFGRFRFVFIGGKVEETDYKIIAKQLDFPVYSLINKIDLHDLMLVLRSSDYFIGVDSGPKNMAHIADLRSISLLGPGPHMFMPLSKKDIILDKSNGCGLYQRFFYKRNSFIKKITSEEVFESFKKLANKHN